MIHLCVQIHNQLATFMRIFAYKLAIYLSTGDVAGLQNALYRGLAESALEFLGHIGLWLFLAVCRQLMI